MACIDKCHDCGEPVCENQCTCQSPDYSNIGECKGSAEITNCVNYSGNDDTCLAIVKPIGLTTVLQKLIAYTKNIFNRVTSDSLVVTTPGACDDLKIELVPSTDGGNTLSLGTDGKPFVPTVNVSSSGANTGNTLTIDISGDGTSLSPLTAVANISPDGANLITTHSNGLYAHTFNEEDLCNLVPLAFPTDFNQQNGVDQTSYDFLASGTGNCVKISTPLGFAVTGNNRKSAFGAMEWFDTLTLANASATAGDTVLIFQDTTENLNTVPDVNYHGVGQHSIAAFTTFSTTICTLHNLTILGDAAIGYNSKIITSGVIFKRTLTLGGSAQLINGSHIVSNPLHALNVTANSFLDNFFSNGYVGIADSGKINKLTLINTLDPLTSGHDSAIFLNSGNVNVTVDTPQLTNSYVYSLYVTAVQIGNPAVDLLNNATAAPIVSNVIGISDGGYGVLIISPDTTVTGGNLISNITGFSSVNFGINVIGTVILVGYDPAKLNYNYLHNQSNLNGYSFTSSGLSVVSCTITNSNGTSLIATGITVSGGQSYNSKLINCRGESFGNAGLLTAANCYIVGGTFISNKDNNLGTPIIISYPDSSFYISGATTIARNINAYAVTSLASIPNPIRISGCNFLNSLISTGILGIDNTGVTYGFGITLRAVSQDAYFNIIS